MTISGVLIAGIFFLISSSKPLKVLSPEHPPSKLFSASILATITRTARTNTTPRITGSSTMTRPCLRCERAKW